MNATQRSRISDYIRWGLTQEQAENWVLSGIYPDCSIMKECRRNRWAEQQSGTLRTEILRKKVCECGRQN